MKYLRSINESQDFNLDLLKDSLTELTDNRKVIFHKQVGEVIIGVKLDNYYSLEEFSEFEGWNELLKKSTLEISEIVKVFEEGEFRSQIECQSIKFAVESSDYWNWKRETYSGMGYGLYSNVLVFLVRY
jgi:hypothetical protein